MLSRSSPIRYSSRSLADSFWPKSRSADSFGGPLRFFATYTWYTRSSLVRRTFASGSGGATFGPQPRKKQQTTATPQQLSRRQKRIDADRASAIRTSPSSAGRWNPRPTRVGRRHGVMERVQADVSPARPGLRVPPDQP